MLTKSLAKFIKSLQLKKNRQAERMFIVEGEKSVLEAIASSFSIEYLFGTPSFLSDLTATPKTNIIEVNENQLVSIGTFKSNNSALAVAKIPEERNDDLINISKFFVLADDIKDPGNLGTIVRLVDWYNLGGIIASTNTTDIYNPKAVAATKGSIFRVPFYYKDLSKFLKQKKYDVFAADMDGKSVHDIKFPKQGYLLVGNEANGISPSLKSYTDQVITIPKYGNAESLNVAMATGIIIDNILRRH